MRRALALLVLLVLGAGGMALLPGGEEIAGRMAVVDGDTLGLGRQRIRLEGVDAPESRQACRRGGADWPCGAEATLALRRFVEGKQIRCVANGRDRYGRVLAHCRADGEDIGAWLVRQGWAVAYTQYSWRYLPQELLARWHGDGLWSGSFETPEAWRRRHAR